MPEKDLTRTGRDEQYLTDTVRFGKLVVIIAGILGHLPSILHPAIAPLLCLPIRQLERRTARKIRPILEQRLRAMEDNDIVVPEDRLQMMLRHAHAHVPQELNVKDITGRLINANFGAIHQTGYAATNVILDILGSDCEFDTIKIIREEVQETLLRHGEWNRTAFEEMVHTDSIIRESLRLHGFSSHIPRMVTAKDGVMTEDGFHIPRGTLISVMQRAPHLDETKFPDPKEYQPFRFSAQRTVSSTESSKPPALRVVNLSDSHMAFGFGRHACPGRFIVDCEIKMIVAYMFMNYEVRLAAEHRGVRPPSLRRLGATFPPQHANIEIKARPQMQFPMTTE
jgi:cytochrome P450